MKTAPSLTMLATLASVAALATATPAHADEPAGATFLSQPWAPPLAAAPASPRPSTAPDPWQPLRGPSMLVHMVGGHVVLERLTESGTWVRHCTAPCDVNAPLDSLYRVTADGMIPSKGFRLHGMHGERTVLDVQPTPEASKAARTELLVGGGVLLGVGGVSLLAYAVSAAASSAVSSCTNVSVPDGPCTNGTPPQTLPKGVLYAGLAAVIGGGVGLVAGLATGRPTSVEQSADGGEQDLDRARPPSFVRPLPTWHESQATPPPPMAGVPLLSGTF